MSEHSEPSSERSSDSDFEPKLVDRWSSGGHEIDAPIARPLFILTGVMLVLTVLSGIGVSQLFQANSADMIEAGASQPYDVLVKHRETMGATLSNYSQDATDKKRFRVPVTQAIDTLAKQPGRLRAAPAPPDFIHPDDEKQK